MTGDLPHTRIVMVRQTLDDPPDAALPSPYSMRRYRAGDAGTWVRIHELADRYNKATAELYLEQFGSDDAELGERQLYICDGAGAEVGTVTAWHNADFPERNWGRVHWVAIVPAHQGRGLGKPLLGACLQRLLELGYEGAYLTTSPPRVAAINLYLRFGFVPNIKSEESLSAWRLLRGRIKKGLSSIVGAAIADSL